MHETDQPKESDATKGGDGSLPLTSEVRSAMLVGVVDAPAETVDLTSAPPSEIERSPSDRERQQLRAELMDPQDANNKLEIRRLSYAENGKNAESNYRTAIEDIPATDGRPPRQNAPQPRELRPNLTDTAESTDSSEARRLSPKEYLEQPSGNEKAFAGRGFRADEIEAIQLKLDGALRDPISAREGEPFRRPGEVPDYVLPRFSEEAVSYTKALGVKYRQEIANAFAGDVDMITLQPGDKIYRVFDTRGYADGVWWSKTRPETDEREMRNRNALPSFWNGDGAYVEYKVPHEMRVMIGGVAPQEVRGGYLNGSGKQLYIIGGTGCIQDAGSYTLHAVKARLEDR